MVYCLILLFKNLVSNSSRGVAELEVESFFEIKVKNGALMETVLMITYYKSYAFSYEII